MTRRFLQELIRLGGRWNDRKRNTKAARRRRRGWRLRLERLEPRWPLTDVNGLGSAMLDPYDVDGDGKVTSDDASAIIDFINSHQVPGTTETHPKYDVNRDGVITPSDALVVINLVNNVSQAGNPHGATELGAGGEQDTSMPQVGADSGMERLETAVLAVPDLGLTIVGVGKGSSELDDPPLDLAAGLEYVKLGTGQNSSWEITGERDVFGPGSGVYVGAHYTNLWSDRWCGDGWYRPDGSTYWENRNQFQIPNPSDYGYEYWSWYNVCFWYDPMPQSMSSVEGRWAAKWWDQGNNAATKPYTVMYDLTDRQVGGHVDPNYPYDPSDVRTVFTTDDARVYSWLRFDDYALNGTNDVKWRWFGPEGFYTEWESDIPNPGTANWYEWYKSWCWMSIDGQYPETHPGAWYVDVYVKDEQGNYEPKFTQNFTIETGPFNGAPVISPPFPDLVLNEDTGVPAGVSRAGFTGSISGPQQMDGSVWQPIGFDGQLLPAQDSTETGTRYRIFDVWGGNWSDAEKDIQSGDDLLCWAGAASNVLEWTGWGLTVGMTTTDQMFQHFQDHWTDQGSLPQFGWNWWYNGVNPADGWPEWAQIDVPGGGSFFSTLVPSEYIHTRGQGPDARRNALADIAQYSQAGYGVALGVFGSINHAITCWGFNYDPNLAPTDPAYYKGLWITDSDDNKNIPDGNAAPNVLHYYAVAWDAANQRYDFDAYFPQTYIGEVDGLERREYDSLDLWEYAQDSQTPDSCLTFTIAGNTHPECGAEIEANRYLRVHPQANWHGFSDVTIRVSDGALYAEDTLRVTVNPVNDAPVLDEIGNKSVDEETLLQFTVTAGDPNDTPANNVTLSGTGLPPGATFDPATGVFAWTPTEVQEGQYAVRFTATDDGRPPLSDSEDVTITVNEVNDAPPAEIRGSKWNDLDGDRARDDGEPGLPGWTIYVDANRNGQRDDGEPYAITEEKGEYVLRVADSLVVDQAVRTPGFPDLSGSDYFTYVSPDARFGLTHLTGSIGSRTWDAQPGQWANRQQLLGFPNSYGYLSPDGNTMYLTSSDPPGGQGEIYRSRWDGSNWSTPQRVANADTDTADHHPTFNGRQIYWTRLYHDVYVADYDATTDRFSNPRAVDSINTSEWAEQGAWVSSDGCLLIFQSDRPGGYGGWDLWYATRSNPTGEWTNITNLGPDVNTADGEFEGRIAEQAGLLFFLRNDAQGSHQMQASVAIPLPEGTYVVAEEMQPGWVQTTPQSTDDPLFALLNPGPGQGFGNFIAPMGGDNFLVGAPFNDTGKVYLYDASTGSQLPFALPPLAGGDWFGTWIVTKGNDLVVGAQGDDTGASNAGAAWLLKGDTGEWTRLTNPTPGSDDRFGYSVAFVGDDVVVVGSPYDDTIANEAGAAYWFKWNGSSWVWNEGQTLYGSGVKDWFGVSMTASGNELVVGAPTYGVPGSAYVYQYDGTTFNLVRRLENPTPAPGYDAFGNYGAIAFVGGKVLVGAPYDQDVGAAYLFDPTTGAVLQTFRNPTPSSGDRFGDAVAASASEKVLIAARHDDTGAENAGAAYLFDASTGNLLQTYLNPTADTADIFGSGVAVVGNKVVMGAMSDSTAAYHAGAAYLFWGPDVGSGAGAYTLSLSPGQIVDNLDFGNRRLPNHAPIDMTLSNASVAENEPAGAPVGTFSTTDSDAGDSLTYTLVSGTGDADNALFTIDGNQLKTATAFDYETKNSYSIRVRTTDEGGLWYEEPMVITVTDVPEAGLHLSLLPLPGSTLSVFPGATASFSVVVTESPEDLIGYQLVFRNSDVAAGQLHLQNWVTGADWPLLLDGTLDTPADGFVAAARLDGASRPLELGTFDVVAPMVAGDYLLTVNYVLGGPFDTAFVGEGGLIPIEDFGDVIITVLDDAVPPEADLAAPLAGQLTNQDPGYIDVRWVDPGLPATGVNPLTIDVHDIAIDNGGRALSVDRVVILGGDIYRYHYGDDRETLSDGTVTVTFVGGEVEDMLGNPNVEENETFTFDGTAPVVTSVVINGGLFDPLDLPGKGSQPTSWAEQRSDIRTLVISFSEGASTVTLADLELISLGVDAPAEPDIPVLLTADQLSQAGNVLTIRFGRDHLPDGVYQLRVLPSVTDAAGNRLDGDSNGEGGDAYMLTGSSSSKFYKLTGDWNGDTAVTILDFPTLAYWFGQTVPPTPEYVDLNGDGGISILDFPVFRANFGKAVVFPVETIAIAMAGNLGGWGGNVSPDTEPSADQFEFVQSLASGSLEGIGGGFLVSAGPLHPYDVNGDLQVTSDDALEIIKFIDSPVARLAPHPVYDVNGDQLCTPLDALLVINFVKAAAGQVAEAEGGVDARGAGGDSSTPAPTPEPSPSRLAAKPQNIWFRVSNCPALCFAFYE